MCTRRNGVSSAAATAAAATATAGSGRTAIPDKSDTAQRHTHRRTHARTDTRHTHARAKTGNTIHRWGGGLSRVVAHHRAYQYGTLSTSDARTHRPLEARTRTHARTHTPRVRRRRRRRAHERVARAHAPANQAVQLWGIREGKKNIPRPPRRYFLVHAVRLHGHVVRRDVPVSRSNIDGSPFQVNPFLSYYYSTR